MTSGRVQQIIDSKENISVYYKNTPVWIEEVNKKDDLVKVKNLNTDKDMLLSVKTIHENYGLNN